MDTMQMADLALATDPDLGTFFLARLAGLVARHAAASTPKERVMFSIAAFSIFLDCVDLGLGAEAQVLIGQVRDAAAGQAVA